MFAGIIFTAYNVRETAVQSLTPFLRPEFEVVAVSVPFKEYKDDPYDDNTVELLRPFDIKIITEPKFILEAEARNLAINALPSYLDYYWIVDGDEIYTKEQIDRILEYLEQNSAMSYSLCFKNYVKESYMLKPFVPPRIFKSYSGFFRNPKFYWDNDVCWQGANEFVSYKKLPHKTVPVNVAWIDHYTWLDDDKSRRKVEYQKKHFGHCSFKWENGHLEFDEEYFKKTGEEIPELA